MSGFDVPIKSPFFIDVVADKTMKTPLDLAPQGRTPVLTPSLHPQESLYFNQAEPLKQHSIIKGSFDHVVSKTLIPQGHDYDIVEDK